MYVRICHAISDEACDAATMDGDDVVCEEFDAIIRDAVKPVSPATKTKLVETDKTVTVQHDDTNDAMTSGQSLIIAQTEDGYWWIIKWIC